MGTMSGLFARARGIPEDYTGDIWGESRGDRLFGARTVWLEGVC